VVDGRELASIRYPTTEPLGEARENCGRRDHRDLLSDDLKDQGAERETTAGQPPGGKPKSDPAASKTDAMST